MKRKSKTKSGLLIIATFLLVSCASVGVSTIKHYPAKPKDCSLEVFTSESEIKKEYEVIALIDSKTGQTEFSNKTSAKAIELAKPKACQCGADGILVISSDRQGMSYGSLGYGKATVKAIKYK